MDSGSQSCMWLEYVLISKFISSGHPSSVVPVPMETVLCCLQVRKAALTCLCD